MRLFREPFPDPATVVPAPSRDHRHATQLFNASMSYARLILRRYGELAPFAFSIDHEGVITRETLEIPRLPRDPERLFKLLTDHVATRIQRGLLTGVAVAANVTLATPSAEKFTDAILLTIEQQSGHALLTTVPYKIHGGQLHNLIPRRITLGQTVTEEATPRFFSIQHL
ncbi:MAG TPA: hypothetical protein VHZ25_06455 [Acidobacteriaceae bacterium]|jgi:hypothetical protein|nr:hypothetical protein [Acidobacteriaceae bacterium]